MRLRTKIAAIVSAAALSIVGWAVPAAVAVETNQNDAPYWEAEYGLECTKFDPPGESNPHGELAAHDEGEAKGVKLYSGAALLVVKGGNTGREVYVNPAAGIHMAPTNTNGKYAEVSHWIVCFDDTPPEKCYEWIDLYEVEWVKETEGSEGVKEYRWEAIFKKGKELKNWEVTGDNTWTNHDDGQWYELPEHKQPERFDGIAPTGTVPLSVYGGPGGVSTQYQYGVTYTVYYPEGGPDAWTEDGTTPDAPQGSNWGERKWQWKVEPTQGSTEYQWLAEGVEPDGDGWTKTGETRKSGEEKVEVPCDDVCPNIEGVQDSVPNGMYIDNNGDCVTPPEDVWVCIDDEKVKISAAEYASGNYVLYNPDTCGQYEVVIDCEAIEAKFPHPADGDHINATFVQLDNNGEPTGEEKQFNAYWDSNTEGYLDMWKTNDFTAHPEWPGWTHFRIVWVQVNSHYPEVPVDCGEPDTVTLCVPDGNGGWTSHIFVEGQVPEEYADNFEWNEQLPNNGCFYKTFVCWEIDNPVDDFPGALPVFPQSWQTQGMTDDEVREYCEGLEVECEDIRQFQLDRYLIDGYSDEELLEVLKAKGLFSGHHTGADVDEPGDGAIYDQWHEFLQLVGADCYEPVEICWFDAEAGENGEWVAKEVDDDEVTDSDILWTGNPKDCYDPDTSICFYDEQADGGPAWVEKVVYADEAGDARPWTGNPKDCYDPDTSICFYDEQADGGPAWVEKVVYADEAGDARPWTGDARDCFDLDGKVKICHATASDQNPYNAIEVSFNAIFNGSQWEFDFANGHGEDNGTHGADIIPPFSQMKNGHEISFPGKNWPAEFEGEGGWDAWLEFWANDCEDPVDSSIDTDWSGGICADPNGSYSYTVTVGSFEFTHQFYIVKDGGTPQMLGTVAPNETDTFSSNSVEPGSYELYAVPVVPVASIQVAENVVFEPTKTPAFGFTFTIENPEDCASLDPTFLGGICDANAPYLQFEVVLDDPYGDITFPETAELEFLNTKNADGNTTIDLTLRTDAAAYTEGDVDYSYSAVGTTHTWTGLVLWPGAAVDGLGNATDWPGWETNLDGSYTNVGLSNYGWTRDGVDITVSVNPEVTVEDVNYPAATPECDTPPPVEVCEYTDGEAQMVTYYGEAPDGSIPWVDGTECTPVVICALDGDDYGPMEIMVSELQETDRIWDPEAEFQGGCREPQEPSLTGSFLNSVCVADSPWLRYSITIHNPDDQPLDGVPEGEEPTATITFVNTGGEDYVIEDVPITELGYLLWPGAEVEPAQGLTEADIDPTDPSTFVPTNWPGWYQDELGRWFQYEDPQVNFGWTRDGVDVLLEVNPETTINVNYPPPTPTCVSEPPEEFEGVLGAPPAEPVSGVATYAG